jgi:hypothetical protein
MESRRPRALLIGENSQDSSHLEKYLRGRGCECDVGVSYEDACSLLAAQGFDLVLSPTRLRNASLFPLIRLLNGSRITLFYSHAVEDGCLWLPALRRGEKCFGSSALRPSEFVSVLDETIEEVRCNGLMAGNTRQSSVDHSAVSMVPFPSREFLSVAPSRAKVSELVKRKAAG